MLHQLKVSLMEQWPLEFSNTTPLPAKIYANEGVAQFLFLKGDQDPETSYADRKGKYMYQSGLWLYLKYNYEKIRSLWGI